MVSGGKTIRQAARWLRSRFGAGALILGYHCIAGPRHDPYQLCVSPRHFAEQLAVLRHYARSLTMEEAAQGLGHAGRHGALPPRAVVVTLDDGYADNLYEAMPLLEHYQIPATVFITTGYFGREFWWDELEQIICSPAQLPDQLHFSLDGRVFMWAPDRAERSRLLQALHAYLLPLGASRREEALAYLRDWADVPADIRASHRALRPEEVRELGEGELIEIGAHSVTHPVLAYLPEADQRAELTQSKQCLEQLLGRPVNHFSYPNGSAAVETEILVREAGFVSACTSRNDVARLSSDLFHLPRFWVPDWDGATFGRWLERWLRG